MVGHQRPPSAPPTESPALPPLVSVVLLALIAAAILFVLPRPASVPVAGWRMLAIFVCTIVAMILRPVPGGAAVLIGVVVAIVTGILTPAQALSGYGNPTGWLILCAFFISRAVINSGLARRLALLFVRAIGHTSLGLGYAMVGCDIVMASVIPGNSARIGGILMPVARILSSLYQSMPGSTANRLGTYLMLVIYQGDMVACAMFLTGQVGNPIAASLAMSTFGVSMTWSQWLAASIVPGLVGFLIVPWFVYRMSPPDIRHTPEAAKMARDELAALGPASFAERKVLAALVLVCGLWATSAVHGLDTITVALAGVVLLLVTRALDWSDITDNPTAWDVFLWFGGIIRMGEAIHAFGVTTAFATSVSAAFAGWSWPAMMALVAVLYFYMHYLFASVTTHIVGLYVPLCTVLVLAGAPVGLVAFSMAFYANLSACLTHYGTTPGPILFSSGYVPLERWWGVGFLISFVHLIVWAVVGLAWWRVLGLW
jgi:DASS family divalent anion:Na+ symporter